jgi:hypothetical protein
VEYVKAIVEEMRDDGVTGYIVIFADGFPGHLSLELQIWCRQNEVLFFILLPNATHLMQPLDVVVFRPVKAEFKKQLIAYKTEKKKTEIGPVDLITIIARTYKKVIVTQPELVRNSFAKVGLFPLKNDAIPPEKFLEQDPASLSSIPVSFPSITVPVSSTATDSSNSVPLSTILEELHSLKAQIGNLTSIANSQVSSVPANTSEAPVPMPVSAQDSLTEILLMPSLPAAPKVTRFKLPRQGNMSSNRIVNAYKENAETKKIEAEKKEKEQQQKLKRRQDVLEEKKAVAEKNKENKRLKREEREMKKKQNDEKKKIDSKGANKKNKK